MTLKEAVEYEIAGSGWASFIGWEWLQDRLVNYFLWRARTKLARYERFLELRIRVNMEVRGE